MTFVVRSFLCGCDATAILIIVSSQVESLGIQQHLSLALSFSFFSFIHLITISGGTFDGFSWAREPQYYCSHKLVSVSVSKRKRSARIRQSNPFFKNSFETETSLEFELAIASQFHPRSRERVTAVNLNISSIFLSDFPSEVCHLEQWNPHTSMQVCSATLLTL